MSTGWSVLRRGTAWLQLVTGAERHNSAHPSRSLRCHGPARSGAAHDAFEPFDIVMFSKMIGQTAQTASLGQSRRPSLGLDGAGQVHSGGGVVGLDPRLKHHCGGFRPCRVIRSSRRPVAIPRLSIVANGQNSIVRIVGVSIGPKPPTSLQLPSQIMKAVGPRAPASFLEEARWIGNKGKFWARAWPRSPRDERCNHAKQGQRASPKIAVFGPRCTLCHESPRPPVMSRTTTGPRRRTMTQRKISVIGPISINAASEAICSAAMLRRSRWV